MGLELFLEHIIKPPIKDHIIDAILSQVQHERDGQVIHRSTVKGCTDVFLTLERDKAGTTVYKCDFEPTFLKKSETFYFKEGKELVASLDTPEFLRVVSPIFVINAFLTSFRSTSALRRRNLGLTIICQVKPLTHSFKS